MERNFLLVIMDIFSPILFFLLSFGDLTGWQWANTYFSSWFSIVNSEQKIKNGTNDSKLGIHNDKKQIEQTNEKKNGFQTKCLLSIPLRQRASTYAIHSLVFA